MRKRIYQEERLANLLSVLAYSPSDKVFLLDDESIGFGFVATPLYGGDDRVAERIQALLRGDWPADTLLQFQLVSTRNIEHYLGAIELQRHGYWTDLNRKITTERVSFLRAGVDTPIIREAGVRVRDFLLVVTCRVKIDAPEPTETEIEALKELRVRFEQSLATVGFSYRHMTADDYLEVTDSVVNRSHEAGWRRGHMLRHDPEKLLKNQVFAYDNDLTVEKNRLTLGDGSVVKTLSVKQFPNEVHFGQAAAYIGDLQRGTRGLRDDFIIHATIQFPDPHKAKSEISTKRAWAVNQAYGPMLKFVPALAKKKHGFDILSNALEDKDAPVRFYFGVTLIADNAERASAASSNAISYFSELGFMLMEDRFFVLPFFLHSLPFGGDPSLARDLFRYKTMATRHTIPMLPIFGDWKGTGAPTMNLISRNGQLMNVCMFDSSTNMNTLICAESGAGKSYIAQEIISSYLSVGARVWVIDVGRSYEKLCNVYGGRFIHFGPGTNICLNPFPILRNWDEEADILASLFSTMAAPTQPLTDFQGAQLKRILKETWDAYGAAANVDRVVEALVKEPDQRIRDIGQQLHSFSSAGEYGRYFNGDNNMGFESDFAVLELEELKGRKHLQQVVLLQLIFQIQQDIYLGARDRKKLVVLDEAWEALSSGGDVATFLAHSFRRFRKYGAGATVITQGIGDVYESSSGRAIAENSANMLLLQQKPESIERASREGQLPFGEAGIRAMKTIHTVRGKYSEVLCVTNRGIGIGRLVVDRFRNLLYSTTAEEVQAIKELEAQGLTTAEAIQRLVDQNSQSGTRENSNAA